MNMIDQIRRYQPENAQEEKDKEVIVHFLETNEDAFFRTNTIAHMSASAWVVNKERTKVLMCNHKIYHSWSWLGGHADGEKDLLKVAIEEVRQESGIKNVRALTDEIISLEILTVDGHVKNGEYVSSHLHLNVTYLLEADDTEELSAKEDENSGVAWFLLDEALQKSTEPWFVEHVYKKLNEKLQRFI